MSERERFLDWYEDEYRIGWDDQNPTDFLMLTAWRARADLAEQREAELVEALRELRSAEWMVTPDWCEPGKRDELNDRIDAILAKHKPEGREGS